MIKIDANFLFVECKSIVLLTESITYLDNQRFPAWISSLLFIEWPAILPQIIFTGSGMNYRFMNYFPILNISIYHPNFFTSYLFFIWRGTCGGYRRVLWLTKMGRTPLRFTDFQPFFLQKKKKTVWRTLVMSGVLGLDLPLKTKFNSRLELYSLGLWNGLLYFKVWNVKM